MQDIIELELLQVESWQKEFYLQLISGNLVGSGFTLTRFRDAIDQIKKCFY